MRRKQRGRGKEKEGKECIVFSKFYVKSKFVSRILLQVHIKKRGRKVFKDD